MRSVRRGFTLVEVLAVMAVFSVTLSTIVLTLHVLQKAGSRAHAKVSAGVELDRFATQFRTDAHAARTFTTSPTEPANGPASVLTLTLPNEQLVEYQLSADQILRRVRAGDVDQHRESYRVQPVLEQGWIVAANTSAPLLSVNLRPAKDHGNQQQGLAPLSVNAAVGLTSPILVAPAK